MLETIKLNSVQKGLIEEWLYLLYKDHLTVAFFIDEENVLMNNSHKPNHAHYAHWFELVMNWIIPKLAELNGSDPSLLVWDVYEAVYVDKIHIVDFLDNFIRKEKLLKHDSKVVSD